MWKSKTNISSSHLLGWEIALANNFAHVAAANLPLSLPASACVSATCLLAKLNLWPVALHLHRSTYTHTYRCSPAEKQHPGDPQVMGDGRRGFEFWGLPGDIVKFCVLIAKVLHLTGETAGNEPESECAMSHLTPSRARWLAFLLFIFIFLLFFPVNCVSSALICQLIWWSSFQPWRKIKSKAWDPANCHAKEDLLCVCQQTGKHLKTKHNSKNYCSLTIKYLVWHLIKKIIKGFL